MIFLAVLFIQRRFFSLMDKFFFLLCSHLTQLFLSCSCGLWNIVLHALFSRLWSSHVFLVICHCFGVVSLLLTEGISSNLSVLLLFPLTNLSEDIVIKARAWGSGGVGLSGRSIVSWLGIILFLFLFFYLSCFNLLLFRGVLLWWWWLHIAPDEPAPEGRDQIVNNENVCLLHSWSVRQYSGGSLSQIGFLSYALVWALLRFDVDGFDRGENSQEHQRR